MKEDYSIIGKSVPRVDALAKVTGRALYSADMSLPNMLHGKVLWSPYAHAKIRSIDITKAEALEGVKAVITAADVPGQKTEDENLNLMTSCLARDRVIFAGQPLAAVAATNLEVADDAVKLIDVDYEELTPAVDVLEAMKPDAPLVHPNSRTAGGKADDASPSNIFFNMKNHRGDLDAGFKEADIVLENTFRTQTVHHTYLEPRAALVNVDPDGKVTVWSDNQGIFELREVVAEFLELPLNYVKVIPVEIGGAFGGKSHQVLPPLCALLSKKAGRPVKMVQTREEVFKTNRPAPASVITVKMGVKKDGLITAASINLIYDYGALVGHGGMPEVPFAVFNLFIPYCIPNANIECNSVYTHKTPSGPYRAPAATQATFAIESQVDLLARALEMDPLEFRLKNVATEGDLMPDGTAFPRVGFKETLERMQRYLKESGPLKGENRGRGVACGYWSTGAGPAAAHVNLNADGTVILTVGSVDVSGTRTSLAQVVAEEFSIPLEKVTVVTGDSETAPFSVLSAGSMITSSLVPPVCRACQDVKEQLCRLGASKLGVEPSDVAFIDGCVRVKEEYEKSISIEDLAKLTGAFGPHGFNPIVGRGASKGPPRNPVLAVGAADIEVDKETGKVKILSYTAAQDIGLAINPTMVEGQIQGAVVQGIGWALTENHISEKGVMQNATLLDYRIPTAADVPFVEAMLVEVGSNTSLFGIRGVGEPPLVPTPAAMANAVHSAIGVRLKELPMDPEAIVRAQQKQV